MAGRRKDATRSERRRRSRVMSEGWASVHQWPQTEPACESFDRVSVPTSRTKEAVMHAVVRSYSGQGASELFEQLEQRNEEIKDLIGGGPGFVSYTALRSSRGRRHRHRLPRQEPDRRGVSATRRVGQGGPQEH